MLRQLRNVRWSVPLTIYQTLIITLVLSRLDYGNATLAGLPACLLNRLHSVLNTATWSIANLRRSDHITDALISLHWLCVPQRINFRLATLAYRSLCGTAPRYLADDLRRTAEVA